MTQTGITGGLVSVEDGLKDKEEYAPARKVRVELSFAVPDNDAPKYLDYVAGIADAQVKALLGQKPAKIEVATDPKKTAQATAEIAKTGPKRTPKSDKDKLAEQAGVLVQTDIEDVIDQTKIKSDPLEAVEPEKPAADPDDLETIAPATEITDQQLTDAVQGKNKVLKETGDAGAPAKIRALIGSYNPDTTKAFTIREIAQKDRTEFLEKLKQLA